MGSECIMATQRKLVDDGDGWIIEERLHSDGPTSVRSYYFRDQLAIRQELKTVGARRLAGLKLIEKDIRTLASWVTTLKELTTELVGPSAKPSPTFMPKDARMIIIRGLFVAVLATYGKMFTQAEGRGTALHRVDCGINADRLKSHEWLMHQRHTFAAHSGIDSAEGCRIAVAIDFKGRTPLKLFAELHQPAAIDPRSLDEISALLSVLHANVNSKLKKAIAFAHTEAREEFPESRLKKLRKGARGPWLLRGGKERPRGAR
jgi:hypothetical protein